MAYEDTDKIERDAVEEYYEDMSAVDEDAPQSTYESFLRSMDYFELLSFARGHDVDLSEGRKQEAIIKACLAQDIDFESYSRD
jgi:hypothetical protein